MAESRCKGFTLVEVLVALAILAVALLAAGRAIALSSVTASETRMRVLAGFVADNRVADLAARRAWPPIGRYEGRERQAGTEFLWRIEVSSTPHPGFRRLEVRVAAAEDAARELRRLVAVLPRDPTP